MRRLIFLDFLRGVFVIYILVVHSIGNIAFGGELEAINDVNTILVILLSPLIIIGTWAPIFAFISGTANVYVFHNLMEKERSNSNLKKIIKGNLLNNGFILILSYINMIFLHPSFEFNEKVVYPILSGWIETGTVKFYPETLFFSDALHIIALSGFFVSLTIYFLWKNNGFAKKRRNNMILSGIGIFVLLITPLMQKTLEPIYFELINNQQYLQALILKTFIGPRQSTFPNMANAFIGAIFGIALAQNTKENEVKEFGLFIGFLFLALDFLILIPEIGINVSDFTDISFPITIYLLNIGLQILVFIALISNFEYKSYEKRVIKAKRTVGIRRFGLFALSVYMFEGIIASLVAKIYIPLWGPDFDMSKNILSIALFVLMIIGIWYLILRLWERNNFKYSAEWWIVNIVGKIRGRKSSRLIVKDVLYNPVKEEELDTDEGYVPFIPVQGLNKTNLELIADHLTESLESVQEVGVKLSKKIVKIFKEEFNFKVFEQNKKKTQKETKNKELMSKSQN